MTCILSIKAGYPLIHDVLSQTLCSGTRPGQKYNLEFIFVISFQILDEQIKTIVIRIYGTRLNLILLLYLELGDTLPKCTERHHTALLQASHRLCRTIQRICLSGQDISLFQTLLHTL